jgi:hypothetical protein
MVTGVAVALSAFYELALATEGAVLKTRWTAKEDSNSDFYHVVDLVNAKTSSQLSVSDFMLFEDTRLASSRFRTYLQMAGQLPINGRSIRVWTNLGTGGTIQVEAAIEGKQGLERLRSKLGRFVQIEPDVLQKRTMAIVRAVVKAHPDDSFMRTVKSRDEWFRGEPVRSFKVSGKRGTHLIRISLESLRIISKSYQEFPQADRLHTGDDGELSIPAYVYPIYDVVGGTLQGRVIGQLRHLKNKVARVSEDPYSTLRLRRYLEDMQSTTLGATAEGQAQGYWSTADLKTKASLIRSGLPLSDNGVSNGLVLEGRYATVSIHPDAAKMPGLNFTPALSANYKPGWKEVTIGNEVKWEMVPGGSIYGRPLTSFEDAFSRPARHLHSNDPVTYMNDGFDEIQVYYAIDTLMDSMRTMGFTDPDISERPFHAFLYDPDISMRNNAFYTDDTINFTTYSPGHDNAARDNTTTWHELGHGLMDRLMGDLITLNDSGGLAEGMADFVASLVVAKVTNGLSFPGQETFRIVNNTAFFLTNESHDDGEAYGGAMYDLLNSARAKYGEMGTVKVADLTLEAMRLTRNHPSLTAPEWFSHMFFADELGREKLRAPGELKELIVKALAGRNFAFDETKSASFELKHNDKPVGPTDDGSRGKPIKVTLKSTETAKYTLQVRTKESVDYPFRYPLTVKVSYRGAAIQGGIKWVGEENGDQTYVLKSADDVLAIDLVTTGVCDEVNRPDGSCVDYVFIKLLPEGAKKPVGKKRFYLRLKPQVS